MLSLAAAADEGMTMPTRSAAMDSMVDTRAVTLCIAHDLLAAVRPQRGNAKCPYRAGAKLDAAVWGLVQASKARIAGGRSATQGTHVWVTIRYCLVCPGLV